jgi:hypothetical protein
MYRLGEGVVPMQRHWMAPLFSTLIESINPDHYSSPK